MEGNPHIPKTKSKKASEFDLMASKRFYELLDESLPMKGSPEWSPKDCDVLRKLRTIDGFSRRDILSVLEFIASDVGEGFCFARNCRSVKNLRMKWKNGFTKFSTAYNAMVESGWTPKSAGTAVPGKKTPDSPRKQGGPVYEAIMNLKRRTTPASKGEGMKYAGLAAKIEEFIGGLVSGRNWPRNLPSVFSSYVSGLRVGLWDSRVLAEAFAGFFRRAGDFTTPGVFARERNGRVFIGPDDTYADAAMEVAGAYLGEGGCRNG